MYYKMNSENVLFLSLTFISILTSYIPQVDSCWGPSSNGLGEMTPDQMILEGSQLLLECSLHNNTIEYNNSVYEVNSSMILFRFQKQYYREDRIHAINSTAKRLVVEKASIADNGNYFCMLNISGLDGHPLICLSHVKVGFTPQPVTDFKCIGLHYRKLYCSWTPPENPIPTSYHLEDRLHPNKSIDYLARNCGISTENSCEWAVDTMPPYRNTALKFNLLLTGTNQLGVNSQLFVIDHYSIIKPNIPQSLTVSTVTTNSIGLNWRAPEHIEFDEDLLESLIYEIRYFRKMSPNSENPKSRTFIIDGIRNTSIVLTNLFPFITYNISIRCKTIQSKSNEYWSEFSTILETTKPDVPYLAPDLIPESYQTDKNMEGMRTITLFWKHIPLEYRNGKDFHYTIEYKKHLSRKSRAINLLDKEIAIRSDNTTYSFNHMDSKVAYTFKIYGANAQGVSKNSSEITVEQNDIIPHKPSNIDVYSFGGGRYEVQWVEPLYNSESGPIANYTVFWCQNLRPRPFPCEGAIDWTHTSNKSIALELPDIRTNYQFAVSANHLFASSGMSWAECIVPIDGRLEKLSEVHVKTINSSSINVSWKLNCPAQKRVVEGYKIKFCEMKKQKHIDICDKEENIRTDNSVEGYNLNGLEPFTKYRITVLAFSDSGPSEESDAIYVVTAHSFPEDSPSSLRLVNTTDHSLHLSWKAPKIPNGVISFYEVVCNGRTSKVNAQNCINDGQVCTTIISKLDSFYDHNVTVRGCVGEGLCSPFSWLSAQTQVSIPSRMDPPRSEIINSTSVRISWSEPARPNGPIDYYILKLIRTDNTTETYNISGKRREYDLSLDCDLYREESTEYRQQFAVKIKSVNRGTDGSDLLGVYSKSTNLNACLFTDPNVTTVIGVIAGGALGLIILVIVLVLLVRWMKRRITTYNSLRIELPKGLEVPQLVTDRDTDGDNPLGFTQLGRNDSISNMASGMVLPAEDEDSFKNRHGSGLSHTSNSSTDGLIYKNSPNQTLDFFRMDSNASGGQHESILSHYSGGEAHMSSDSGVEIDSQHQNCELKEPQRINRISPKPLAIVDEMSSRNSDLNGSKDSGLDTSARTKRKRKQTKSSKNNNKISTVIMPTNNEAVNPLYDTPMSHSVCIYSLLANSEPSLLDWPQRGEDDNILSDLTKFTKPEMAKSLSNIIQSCNPSDPKVNCIICDTNNSSSRGSTRNSSPICPYYKYGIKRQNHISNNFVTNFSPEKKTKINAKTNNGYITIDSITQNGQTTAPKHVKKRLEHDWSQNSYDAEVSSTSSNGDNEQTGDLITQNNFFTQNSVGFNGCKKIQNNSSVDIEDETELNAIEDLSEDCSPNPSVDECETQLNEIKANSNLKSQSNCWTPLKASPTHPMVKDSNGYVLHNTLSQHLNSNQIKANLIKNSNGYVVIDGITNCIEMNDLVPNNTIVSHVTQV